MLLIYFLSYMLYVLRFTPYVLYHIHFTFYVLHHTLYPIIRFKFYVLYHTLYPILFKFCILHHMLYLPCFPSIIYSHTAFFLSPAHTQAHICSTSNLSVSVLPLSLQALFLNFYIPQETCLAPHQISPKKQ